MSCLSHPYNCISFTFSSALFFPTALISSDSFHLVLVFPFRFLSSRPFHSPLNFGFLLPSLQATSPSFRASQYLSSSLPSPSPSCFPSVTCLFGTSLLQWAVSNVSVTCRFYCFYPHLTLVLIFFSLQTNAVEFVLKKKKSLRSSLCFLNFLFPILIDSPVVFCPTF